MTWDSLGQLHLYDTQKLELAGSCKDRGNSVRGVACLGEGRFAYWGRRGVRFRRLSDMELVGDIEAEYCSRALVSGDGQLLLSSGGSSMLTVDGEAMSPIWKLDECPSEMYEDSRGHYVFVNDSEELLIVDRDDGDIVHRRGGAGSYIDDVDPVGRGRWAVYSRLHDAKPLMIFDEEDWQLAQTFEELHGDDNAHHMASESIAGVRALADGSLMTWDNTAKPQLCLWNKDEGRRRACIRLPAAGRGETRVLLDDSRTRAIVYSDRSDMTVYDLERAEAIAKLEGHKDRVGGILQLEDGRLVSWSHDATIRIWPLDELGD